MSEDKAKKPGFFKRLFGREESAAEIDKETAVTETDLGAVEETQPEKEGLSVSAPPEPSEAPGEVPEDEQGLVKLQTGLEKTRSRFFQRLDEVFLGKREIDEATLGRLEEMLVTADIGVKTAYQLLEGLTERVKRREVDNPDALVRHLKTLMKEMLSRVEAPLRVGYGSEPFVVMVVGVNGSGKTTTIAKIAARHQEAGRKVLLAAADTFRAAAVEQMEVWAERIGCPVVKGKDRADPSAVAFEAVDRALKEDMELVLVDTAGRLHTRVPLVEELKKVHRTLGKKLPGAPHETLLVIDASMGQNAILQARKFNEAVPVTGIALTKLDGTAKGGVILGICNELEIPVRYVGVGEKKDDLRDFKASDFVEALFYTADR